MSALRFLTRHPHFDSDRITKFSHWKFTPERARPPTSIPHYPHPKISPDVFHTFSGILRFSPELSFGKIRVTETNYRTKRTRSSSHSHRANNSCKCNCDNSLCTTNLSSHCTTIENLQAVKDSKDQKTLGAVWGVAARLLPASLTFRKIRFTGPWGESWVSVRRWFPLARRGGESLLKALPQETRDAQGIQNVPGKNVACFQEDPSERLSSPSALRD